MASSRRWRAGSRCRGRACRWACRSTCRWPPCATPVMHGRWRPSCRPAVARSGCWGLLAETGVQSLKSLDTHSFEDDVALGRSLVARLCQSPFDRIKIDQAIIAQVRQDPLGVLRLIRQLVRASHALGLEVVVEGLESPGMIEAAS